MKTLAVMNLKGGSGKTTVATHLAVSGMRLGLVTFILDLDPQPIATLWKDGRETALAAESDSRKKARLATHVEPAVVPGTAARLPIHIKEARQLDTDLLIIDTPAKDETIARRAVEHADAVLVPMKPTPFDLKALPTSIDIIRSTRKPFFVVFNEVRSQGREVEDVTEALTGKGYQLAPVSFGDRKAFYSHMQIGETAEDFDPRGQAATEARALMLWVCDRIGLLAKRVNKSTSIQINKAGAA